jgi:hypothetical protein
MNVWRICLHHRLPQLGDPGAQDAYQSHLRVTVHPEEAEETKN